MNGAPAKPIRGILGGSAARMERTASVTYASGSMSPSGRMRSTSAAVADRVVDDGPFSLGKFEIQPQGLENQEDIGKENGRIDTQALGRGHCHLSRQVGPLAQFEKADFDRGRPGIRPCSGRPGASARSA